MTMSMISCGTVLIVGCGRVHPRVGSDGGKIDGTTISSFAVYVPAKDSRFRDALYGANGSCGKQGINSDYHIPGDK